MSIRTARLGAIAVSRRRALAAGATVVDSFATLDPAWIPLRGTWSVASGVLGNDSGDPNCIIARDWGAASGTYSVRIAATGDLRLTFRATDADNHLLVDQRGIHRVEPAAFTSLTLWATELTFNVGDVLGVELSGSMITAQLNGATVGTTTSTFNQSASKHGVGTSYSTSPRFDDFTATPI